MNRALANIIQMIFYVVRVLSAECSKALKRSDGRVSKLEQDHEELEHALDDLRKELTRTDERKKELLHQVS